MAEKKGMDPKVAAALGAAAGLAVGAVAGALTDPKKRDKIKETAQKLQKSAQNAVKELGSKAQEMRGEVSDRIDQVEAKAKKK